MSEYTTHCGWVSSSRVDKDMCLWYTIWTMKDDIDIVRSVKGQIPNCATLQTAKQFEGLMTDWESRCLRTPLVFDSGHGFVYLLCDEDFFIQAIFRLSMRGVEMELVALKFSQWLRFMDTVRHVIIRDKFEGHELF